MWLQLQFKVMKVSDCTSMISNAVALGLSCCQLPFTLASYRSMITNAVVLLQAAWLVSCSKSTTVCMPCLKAKINSIAGHIYIQQIESY